MEPYEGQEPYIFISYARKDKEQVLPYLDALSGAGYRVWYDAGISAGDEWLKTLLEKVKDCAVFCPMFSKAFSDSTYCEAETNYAIRKKKAIVPLYLEELNQEEHWLVDFLGSQQDLRLYQFDNPAQFAERAEREQMFVSCKIPEWHRIGEIQWRLDSDGVLTIAANEDLFYPWGTGSIPAYQLDSVHISTAPWAPYRKKILSVEIAENIDSIGERAFYGCTSLTNVRIPDSVREIGGSAFCTCYSLTDVRIPDSVTAIGDDAFLYCHSLTNVRIPDSVTTIGYGAFESCKNLKSVEIPAEVDCKYAFPEHTLVTRRDAPAPATM